MKGEGNGAEIIPFPEGVYAKSRPIGRLSCILSKLAGCNRARLNNFNRGLSTTDINFTPFFII